jgi:hypothetical protein
MRFVIFGVAAVVGGCLVPSSSSSSSYYQPPTQPKVDPAQITAVNIVAPKGETTYCAGGDPLALTATVTLSDHRVLEMAAFEWSSTWGQINDGRLTVPRDPFAALGRDVTVEVGVVDRPDLRSSITLTPSYACGTGYYASGAYGQSGRSGESGERGRGGGGGGASQRAGDGEDGQDGGRGGSGSDGGPGHLLRAYAGYVDTPTSGRLIAVVVVDGDQVGRMLFDPAGPKFVLGSLGGAGGAGGDGGRGGDGGSGGAFSADATTEGDGGNGGDGGAGGDGGDGANGGDGGELELIYDRRFPALAQAFEVTTAGGGAGGGGQGGWGGSGGSGGSTSKGRSGQGGHTGPNGRSGRGGRGGADGPPPVVKAGDVAKQFGFLGELGLRIASP